MTKLSIEKITTKSIWKQIWNIETLLQSYNGLVDERYMYLILKFSISSFNKETQIFYKAILSQFQIIQALKFLHGFTTLSANYTSLKIQCKRMIIRILNMISPYYKV